jgi:drug/metabolite transporter (DMT)-like permease
LPDHFVAWLVGVVAGCAATVAVALATRVRLLPEVVDISLVPTLAGVGGLILATYGAMRRFPPPRIGQLTLLGTLIGAVLAMGILGWFLLREVLS